MRYPAAETAQKHEKILDEATRLFREQGFYGVSVGDIMTAANLTTGSFYNHFASKEALMAESLGYAVKRLERRLEAIPHTVEGKMNYISWYLSANHRDNPGAGCPMSPLASEVARYPSVRPSMTHYIKTYLSKLSEHFPWPSKRHARRDAIRTTAALVGAIILARAAADERLSNEIMFTIASDLEERFCRPPKRS